MNNKGRPTIRGNEFPQPQQLMRNYEGRVQRIYVRKWYEKPAVVASIIGGILVAGGLVILLMYMLNNGNNNEIEEVDDPYTLTGEPSESNSSSSSDSGEEAGSVSMSQITVSSNVACCPTSAHSTSYDSNMLDGDPVTAWQIRGRNNNDATATFHLPRACKLSGMQIRNGYQKTTKRGTSLFYANSRPSWVRITLVDANGQSCVFYDGSLADQQGWQTINTTNECAHDFSATMILMTVNPSRVYYGNRYSDVVISDVDFNLKPAR